MTVVKIAVAVACFGIFLLRSRDAYRARSALIVPATQASSKIALSIGSLLLGIAVLLDVGPIYDVVDGWLGGVDVANLVLRGITYVLFLLITTVLARAFNSLLALWLIKGVPGQIALTVAAALTLGSFLLDGHHKAYDSAAGWVYALTWQTYLAYLAVALLTCLLPAAVTPGGYPVLRASAALTAAACLAAISYVPARIGEAALGYSGALSDLLKVATVILLSAGSITPWIARRFKFPGRKSTATR